MKQVISLRKEIIILIKYNFIKDIKMINPEKLSKKRKRALAYFIICLVLDPLNYIGKGFIDDNDIDLLLNALRKVK